MCDRAADEGRVERVRETWCEYGKEVCEMGGGGGDDEKRYK